MFVHKGTCHTPTQSSSDDIDKMGLAAGNGGWLCQHRYTAFTGMVGFRNFVGSQGMTDWVSSGDQRIGFGRGAFPFFSSLLFLFVLIRGMIQRFGRVCGYQQHGLAVDRHIQDLVVAWAVLRCRWRRC
jgi:hypothetical protein